MVARRKVSLDRPQLAEAAFRFHVDGGCQRGDGAGATDYADAGLAGVVVETGDAGDKGSRVGEVYVVGSAGDAGLR